VQFRVFFGLEKKQDRVCVCWIDLFV